MKLLTIQWFILALVTEFFLHVLSTLTKKLLLQYEFLAPQVPTSLVTGMVPLTWKSTRLKTLQELRLKTVHKLHLLGVTGGPVLTIISAVCLDGELLQFWIPSLCPPWP